MQASKHGQSGFMTCNSCHDSHMKLDDNDLAAVTLDFVCLPCHQNETLEWAASYADSIQQKGLVSSIETATSLPTVFALEQNYPNPFNPRTTIKYSLPKATHVRLTVYNVVGQEVAVLVDGEMIAGNHRVVFTARNVASGLYLYRLETDGFVTTKKMLVMK